MSSGSPSVASSSCARSSRGSSSSPSNPPAAGLTASDGGAAPLYESVGFKLAGEIPDYAFKPQGGLTGTKFYWKRLAVPAAG